MNPAHCNFVSPYGIISVATHRSPLPIPDSDQVNFDWYKNLYPNCILQVCPPSLPNFVKHILPTINVPFKLITNNSDFTLPTDFRFEAEELLNNKFLIHWFSQNWVGEHSKVTRIPIGLDYHSLHIDPPRLNFLSRRFHIGPQHPFGWGARKPALFQEEDLLRIKNASRQFWDREIKGYGNFHFHMGMGYAQTDRPDAFNTIPKDLMFYEPQKTTRDICWKNMIQNAFVVSPHGNGLDCHRTWEALALGCIPVIKTSGIDALFDDLPVWIVKEWKEVTLENMKAKIEEFKNRTFNYEKLTLRYWVEIINNCK